MANFGWKIWKYPITPKLIAGSMMKHLSNSTFGVSYPITIKIKKPLHSKESNMKNNKRIAYLGMDVHKNSITMALFVEQRKEEEFTKKVANNLNRLIKLIKKLSEEYHLRVCYETSGCCYTIYWTLTARNSSKSLQLHMAWENTHWNFKNQDQKRRYDSFSHRVTAVPPLLPKM